MQSIETFQEYVKSEFKNIDAAATEFKYAHTSGLKKDKDSGKLITMHYINVGVRFFDKNMKLLHSTTFKFVNNLLTKNCEKKLINISPKELNNKFMYARKEIIKLIMSQNQEKLNDIQNEINLLKEFAGKDNDNMMINDEFKGELIQIKDDTKTDKKIFDM